MKWLTGSYHPVVALKKKECIAEQVRYSGQKLNKFNFEIQFDVR